MRILHLVHQYLPEHIGGTELYSRNLARHQVAEGNRVALFTATAAPQTGAGSAPLPAEEEGVRVYRVPVGPRSPQAAFLSLFRQKQVSAALTAVLDREQPDLIHLQHLIGLPAELVDQMVARQIPFVVTLHDYWYACANAQLLTNYDATICAGPDRFRLNCARCALARTGRPGAVWAGATPLIAPIMMLRQRRLQDIFARARRLVAPTDFVRATYQKLGFPAGKICVIAHGINAPPKRLPREERPAGMPLHVAYIGGLAWQKGVHVLVDAVNRLPAETVRLSIAGDMTAFPGYTAALQEQAHRGNIRFIGSLPPAGLWSFLAGVDLVVVPSLWYETASLIVQEAFAAGVPVIASRIGALQERVRDGVDGFLTPPGDAAALRQLLQRLQQAPALCEQLRSHIQPVRTMAEHFADISAVYHEAMTA